jgi:hypothetical protein
MIRILYESYGNVVWSNVCSSAHMTNLHRLIKLTHEFNF